MLRARKPAKQREAKVSRVYVVSNVQAAYQIFFISNTNSGAQRARRWIGLNDKKYLLPPTPPNSQPAFGVHALYGKSWISLFGAGPFFLVPDTSWPKIEREKERKKSPFLLSVVSDGITGKSH